MRPGGDNFTPPPQMRPGGDDLKPPPFIHPPRPTGQGEPQMRPGGDNFIPPTFIHPPRPGSQGEPSYDDFRDKILQQREGYGQPDREIGDVVISDNQNDYAERLNQFRDRFGKTDTRRQATNVLQDAINEKLQSLGVREAWDGLTDEQKKAQLAREALKRKAEYENQQGEQERLSHMPIQEKLREQRKKGYLANKAQQHEEDVANEPTEPTEPTDRKENTNPAADYWKKRFLNLQAQIKRPEQRRNVDLKDYFN